MPERACSFEALTDWVGVRGSMMLDPSVINLNTGSFGPLPRCVFDRVTALRQQLAAEPMNFLVREAPPLLWQARERLALYLGVEPHRLIFTANVSAAINVVASSLTLAAPGEILLTDHEYGAMHWCWERAAQRLGLTIRVFSLPQPPSRPEEVVAALAAALTSGTRLLFFSHVLSPTGMILPAREMCALARRAGVLTVIDGAHAPAFVDLKVDQLECDFYTGNCHKWMLAPTGAGFLVVGAGNEERLTPLQVSWGWRFQRARMNQRDEFGQTPWIRRFEFEGTRDPSAWLAVPAAIEFQASIGREAIRHRVADLTRQLRNRMEEELGLRCATPTHPEMHFAMTAFWLPTTASPEQLRTRLWQEFRIEAPIIERPEGNLIRVSTFFYNTEGEIDMLLKALRSILR